MRTNTDVARRQEGISFLLIDMNQPGVTVKPVALLDGEPVEFRLVRNPAESIKPEIVEQGLIVLSTYIDVVVKVLGEELSEFTDHTLSLHLSYSRDVNNRWLDKAGISLQWDRIWFDYDNFSDLTDVNSPVGEEKLYDFEADVFKILFTAWY